jgi:hypothetical protein
MAVPLIATFCLLAAGTLALALYRQVIVRFKADECIHLLDTAAPVIEQQRTASKRLETVDAWGKAVTVLTVVCGIAAYVAWWLGA